MAVVVVVVVVFGDEMQESLLCKVVSKQEVDAGARASWTVRRDRSCRRTGGFIVGLWIKVYDPCLLEGRETHRDLGRRLAPKLQDFKSHRQIYCSGHLHEDTI